MSGESLRDTIANAYDEVTAAEIPVEGVKESVIPGPEVVQEVKSPDEKPGRTAGRQRDETGKLLPGKAEKPAVVAPVEAPIQNQVRNHPSPLSWKKEFRDHWDKLDPKLAEYLNQRESEYDRGVKIYKQEWDQVRPLAEAMAQFQPMLQQENIRPEVFVTNLGNAHRLLKTGTPEQKLSAFLKIAQDYQVPVQNLFQQGQDGQIYFNPSVQPHQPAQQQPSQNIEEVVQKVLLERQTAQDIQNFTTATDDKGQLKYPHFEAVKPTMHGLLQANLATDLQDAYQQALALPRHSDIASAIREQEAKTELERKALEQQRLVNSARSRTISPKSSTPSGTESGKTKGVRGAIEAAYDSVVAGGRV
jgi:hypothetical protein